MFIDKVTLHLRSGAGGNGVISFRREKYVPNGGPDGGDGGKGGDVILLSDKTVNSLSEYRFKHHFAAQNGENGAKNKMSGKNAEDIILKVPVGTVCYDDETGAFLFDFDEDGMSYIVCPGGRGGSGNQHYANSTRQAPNFAKPGDEAVEKTVILELKTIADVGVVGFPSVGKSTLLAAVTNARPKIAAYHFTTLSPNLGVVRYKNAEEFIMADIPGLIEGASEGAGLGHEFLRHIERTRVLVHVLDAAGTEGRDPKEDFDAINNEMFTYSEDLASRPMIVALNKIDAIYDKAELEDLKKYFEEKGYKVVCISAATREGCDELIETLVDTLATTEKITLKFEQSDIVIYSPASEEKEFDVSFAHGVYYVTGKLPERLLKTVNLDDFESRNYFQRVLKNKGVFEAVEKKGAHDGDIVDICGLQFEYYK